jgi:hypothetical protein
MSKSPSRRFPVTVTQLPVTRCQICHRTVAYRPGSLSLDDSGVGRAWLLIVLVPGFGCGVWLLLGCSQASRPGVPGACAGSDCAGTCSFPVVVADGAGQVGSGMACSRCQQVRNASFQGQSGLIFRIRWRAWRTMRAGMPHSR